MPQTAGTQPTVDYRGVPFVTKAAPVLKFERRSTPRLRGIDYDFPEQTAQGVTLFSRFPPFTLSDRRIHVGGPWYDNDEANAHFTRGITSVEAMPAYRSESNTTTNMWKVPYYKKGQLINDGGGVCWGYASKLADDLAKVNANDPRIPALRKFANDHEMSDNRAAFLALGHRIWEIERGIDMNQQGTMYPTLDVEQSGGWDYQRDAIGSMYLGMVAEAAKAGCHIVPITYGQWTFNVGAVADSSIDTTTGLPTYLLPSHDFLAVNDPTLQACNDTGGAVSMDGYMQAIWGNEPFYKRNADGSLQLSGGQPIFNDVMTTTLYGAQVPLNANEAKYCLEDLYRQAVRMYLMHHWFAGQYPASSDMRKTFLLNAKIGAWSRITNEGRWDWLGNPIIAQNDRPLPGWEIEMLMGMFLFTADDIVTWSVEMTTVGPLGGPNDWSYNAQGVNEFMIKAAHRYSALDPLHHGTFKWCWFHLPMVNQNTTDGERYYQKPIVFGKIRTYNGQQWLEMYAAWPALDNQSTDMKIWIDKDGGRSPVYTIQLANGRSYFYDAWQLPAGMTDIEGKHVKLQFKDQKGVLRTWCGDYRVTP